MTFRPTKVQLILILLPLLVGSGIGRISQGEVSTWYAHLQKPGWSPPGWVFGAVWTSLYLMMGAASATIWSRRPICPRAVNWALCTYSAQLALNFLWTPLFFSLHWPAAALADLLMLLGTLAATIAQFRRIDTRAALLLYPYFLWGLFAGFLNLRVWQLNC